MCQILSVLLIFTLIAPTALVSAQDTTPSSNDSRGTIARRWRERLEGVPSQTGLIVTLNDGNRVEGLLGELETETFELWVDLPERRDGRVSRELFFADVVRVTHHSGQPVLPRTLPARAVARSSEELSQALLPGDTVHIQDRSGRTIQGLITRTTSSSLTVHGLDLNMGTTTFRPSDVVRMELETTRTTNRAVHNTLIGAGVGFCLAALLAVGCDDPDCGEAAPYAVGLFGALGTGIGLVSGLLSKREIVERRLVYERLGSGWELDLFPILAKDTAGVGVRVGF